MPVDVLERCKHLTFSSFCEVISSNEKKQDICTLHMISLGIRHMELLLAVLLLYDLPVLLQIV
jgi:hypothetical protein